MEVQEDYWRGIDDDMSEGPQFVPLRDFVGKEDRAEPSLDKKKRKRSHGPDEPIKRRQNLFHASPRMRTTRHTGLPSSGDNQRTPSPTRQGQPPPPPVYRRQHSKTSEVIIFIMLFCLINEHFHEN